MTMKVRKKILKAANKTPKSDKLKRQLRAEAAKYTKSTLPHSLKNYKKWAQKEPKPSTEQA